MNEMNAQMNERTNVETIQNIPVCLSLARTKVELFLSPPGPLNQAQGGVTSRQSPGQGHGRRGNKGSTGAGRRLQAGAHWKCRENPSAAAFSGRERGKRQEK